MTVDTWSATHGIVTVPPATASGVEPAARDHRLRPEPGPADERELHLTPVVCGRCPLHVGPTDSTKFKKLGYRVGDRENRVEDQRDAPGRPGIDLALAAGGGTGLEHEFLAPIEVEHGPR